MWRNSVFMCLCYSAHPLCYLSSAEIDKECKKSSYSTNPRVTNASCIVTERTLWKGKHFSKCRHLVLHEMPMDIKRIHIEPLGVMWDIGTAVSFSSHRRNHKGYSRAYWVVLHINVQENEWLFGLNKGSTTDKLREKRNK